MIVEFIDLEEITLFQMLGNLYVMTSKQDWIDRCEAAERRATRSAFE